MINVFQPSLGSRELAEVSAVFKSNWIGRGRKTKQFEEAFARHIGADSKNVLSINCCTEGLFQAMSALELGRGDEVVLPSTSFVGAANAVSATGAKPVFCDIQYHHLNPSLSDIKKAISSRTKAIILIHYGGFPLEIEEITDFCRTKGIIVVEDAANSVASKVNERACGTFGDIGVWSFDAMKVLVTGDGGMIWCRNEDLLDIIYRNINLGLSEFGAIHSKARIRWWEFDVTTFGRRSIVNDISSAIGLVQLDRLADFVKKRQTIHNYYTERLKKLDWLILPPIFDARISGTYYFYWIQCKDDFRDQLAVHLKENGIYVTFRYYPLHLAPIYRSGMSLPASELAAKRTLLLPQHQQLTINDLDMIIGAILEFQ